MHPMAKTSEKPMPIPNKYLRIVGTREAVNVFFQNAEIGLASEIQGIGKELMQTGEVAARIDMPLVVNFQGVDKVSSGLIGKLVLLNKKARAAGVKLEFREMSDPVRTVIQSVTRMLPFDDQAS